MTTLDGSATPAAPTAGRVVCRDGPDRFLLAAAARGVHQQTCRPLDYPPILGRHDDLIGIPRRDAITAAARSDAVPADVASRLDADSVAAWMVDHYPASRYPGVLFGSPHGGSVHLATALQVPWLPSSFTVRIGRPDAAVADWAGALRAGAAVAGRVVAANPDVTVRQVYDPVQQGPICAGALTLHVQWRRVPAAYRRFLRERLAPGAAALVLRDTRTWPVQDLHGGHSFQLGSPSSGWEVADYTMANPSFSKVLSTLGVGRWTPPAPEPPARYAELSGEPSFERDLRSVAGGTNRPTHRVLYPNPAVLSAAVADVYREWIRAAGGPGQRCVIETERLLDPWQVVAAGLVPFWCESASRGSVAGAEWWLAGSDPFDSVQVFPAPPGIDCDVYADGRQWRAAAAFGRSQGWISTMSARRYPMYPLPTSHAAEIMDEYPRRRAVASPLRFVDVLAGLRRHGEPAGLLVL